MKNVRNIIHTKITTEIDLHVSKKASTFVHDTAEIALYCHPMLQEIARMRGIIRDAIYFERLIQKDTPKYHG